MTHPTIALSTLASIAEQLSLNMVGICELSQLSPDKERLEKWQAEGFAGDMKFMSGDSSTYIGTDHILPGARSVLSFSLHYSSTPHPPCPPGYGRVARYAWGQDYHLVLRTRLAQFVSLVEAHLERSFKARVFTDALPFLERAAAKSAGLGFIGKNTLLIKKGIGSYFFLGEVFSDLEILDDGSIQPQDSQGCGSCSRCINSCPTNALVEERVLDARKCISYLTIEKRGALSETEREMIGDWIFGCDICQDVCPFNHTALKTGKLAVLPEFTPKFGIGPLLDLNLILSIRSNREFESIFADTPLLRARRVGLQRNALAVAVNTRARQLIDTIEKLNQESDSETLKDMTLWALDNLV